MRRYLVIFLNEAAARSGRIIHLVTTHVAHSDRRQVISQNWKNNKWNNKNYTKFSATDRRLRSVRTPTYKINNNNIISCAGWNGDV